MAAKQFLWSRVLIANARSSLSFEISGSTSVHFAGISKVDLSGSFRISHTRIGRIFNETCTAIWNTLSEQNLAKAPSSEEE